MLRRPAPPRPARRPGKVLVLFLFVFTALLGMLGLVIDGGMMMASHRQVQNAADSAALAAAMHLMRGYDSATATATATTFVQTYNGMSDATVTINIPPTSGPHAGLSNYAEAIVTRTYGTVFAQAAGAADAHQISARAVAGYEAISGGEGAIVLDPYAAPGLSFNGVGTRLRVAGAVVINSQRSGVDQYGAAAPTGSSPQNPPAVQTSNTVLWVPPDPATGDPGGSYVNARLVHVAGGVDTPANFRDYDDPEFGPNPVYAGVGISPDPLRTLAVPYAKLTAGVVTETNVPSITDWTRKATVSVGNGGANSLPAGVSQATDAQGNVTVTFSPGVYDDINITGGNVKFSPGVYIFSPSGNNRGLRISGGTVTGTGVLFYFTGSNYLDTYPGYWDQQDGHYDGPLPPTNGTLPSDPYLVGKKGNAAKVEYASLAVAGSSGTVSFEGMAYDTTNPDDKMLFFQRRRNTNEAQFGGGGNSGQTSTTGNTGGMVVSMKGTIYAKWAQFKLGGGQTYDSQFIVGSLVLSGGATMTINGTGKQWGRANQVFLVE